MPVHVIGLQKQTIPRWQQNVRKKFGMWSNSGQNRLEYEGKTGFLPSKILRTKLCDEGLIGFKRVLVLEKYILRHNPKFASRDVVDNRTYFLCTGSSLKHNLVLMWLAKKKLKCSCFKIKGLDQSHLFKKRTYIYIYNHIQVHTAINRILVCVQLLPWNETPSRETFWLYLWYILPLRTGITLLVGESRNQKIMHL